MRDFLLGLAFMAVGGVSIIVAQNYPTMSSLQFGPSLFPSLIGGGMLIGGFILTVTQLAQVKSSFASLPAQLKVYNYLKVFTSLMPCVLIIFYILVSELLGAVICMTLSMMALMIMQGTKVWLSIVLSIVVSTLIYMLFSHYLLIPLPEGTLLPQYLTLSW